MQLSGCCNYQFKTIWSCFIILNLFSCQSGGQSTQTNADNKVITIKTLTDSLLADGFDFPVGNADGKGPYTSIANGKTYNSWYIATNFAEKYSLGIHPGIDLNGTGGGDTDLGQPVHAIADGVVVDATNYGAPWGKVIVIKHTYLENGKPMACFSLYAHLRKMTVHKGNRVIKRFKIGEIGTGEGHFPAHLHLEIRKEEMTDLPSTYWPSSESKDVAWVKQHYENPDLFIKSHRKLTSPLKEAEILVAVKHEYKMYHYKSGRLLKVFDISLSQNPNGPKEKTGDLKMPEGEYYICEKQKGPFYGAYAEFLGPCLLRISYPNAFDARKGLEKGLITLQEKDRIVEAQVKKSIPPKNTALGGGIVIHGWKGEWYADGRQNLTWGCISMHNNDLLKLFGILQVKTKIIIAP